MRDRLNWCLVGNSKRGWTRGLWASVPAGASHTQTTHKHTQLHTNTHNYTHTTHNYTQTHTTTHQHLQLHTNTQRLHTDLCAYRFSMSTGSQRSQTMQEQNIQTEHIRMNL